MGMMGMGMGAMNSELMNKLGGRKKPASPEPKAEASEASTGRIVVITGRDFIEGLPLYPHPSLPPPL